MRTFLQLTDDKSKKKAVQVSVNRMDHSSANEPNCGQKKCIEKGRFHPAERCWTLHPERMPQRLQNIGKALDDKHKSPNESTSAKKNRRNNGGRGRGRGAGRGQTGGDSSRKGLINLQTHLMTTYNMSADEVTHLQEHGTLAEGTNQTDDDDAQFEEYPDLGPAKKFRVNRMDVSLTDSDSPPPLIDIDIPHLVPTQPTTVLGLYIDEPIDDETEILNFRVNFMRLNYNGVPDLIGDEDSDDDVPELADDEESDDDDPQPTPVQVYATEKILIHRDEEVVMADSGTQATILSLDHTGLCFNLQRQAGSIITAAGEAMNIIRYRAQTYFLGSVITVFLADIKCSVISATTTCVQNNIQWVFGPGNKGGVFNFSTNTGYPLKLIDNLWPVPIRWFARDYHDADPFDLRSDPFVKPEEFSRARGGSSMKSALSSPAPASKPAPLKSNSIDNLSRARGGSSLKSTLSSPVLTPKPVSLKANSIQYQTPPATAKKYPNPYASAISAASAPHSATSIEKLQNEIASPGPFGKSYAQERLSRILKADHPIGNKKPDDVLTPLIHERLGHPAPEKIQFCSRCTIYRNRGLLKDQRSDQLRLLL